MRLLITGSRNWDDPRPINYLCHAAYHKAMAEFDGKLVVVHGAARGADKLAQDWVDRHILAGLAVSAEAYPLTSQDWATKGKRAGYLRNQLMVDKGADLGAGFIKESSPGASMCLGLMRDAGIPNVGLTWGSRHDFWPTISCEICEVTYDKV